jgi:hypothetical protein
VLLFCFSSSMLPGSLGCHFLITPSVFYIFWLSLRYSLTFIYVCIYCRYSLPMSTFTMDEENKQLKKYNLLDNIFFEVLYHNYQIGKTFMYNWLSLWVRFPSLDRCTRYRFMCSYKLNDVLRYKTPSKISFFLSWFSSTPCYFNMLTLYYYYTAATINVYVRLSITRG